MADNFENNDNLNINNDDVNINGNTDKQANNKTEKKKPAIVRFFLCFIPWKGDKISEIIRKIIFTASVIVICVCAYQLIDHLNIKMSQAAVIEDMQDVYNSSDAAQPLIDALPEAALPDFATLYSINSDTSGWISIPNADINYVVMQSKDSYSAAYDKYLYSKNWKGEDAKYGWLYIDPRCTVSKECNSSNLIVYGHNMYPLDDHLFFSNLVKYESLDYYKQNPVIFFDTLYGKGTYKIFGVMLVDTTATYKNEKVPAGQTAPNHFIFDYINEKYINFADYNAFNEYYSAVTERNLINTEVDVKYGDEILTLSTCENRYFNEGRIVILARRVRPGESEEVNVATAVAASDPLMPDAWVSKGKGKLMQ